MRQDEKTTIHRLTGRSSARPVTEQPRSNLNKNRGFASNIGVNFKTPEEFFLDAPAEEYEKPFDPSLYLHASTDNDPPVFTRQHPRELVIFCGSPGAGKSTFYWNVMEPLGYERVNQDILKSVFPPFPYHPLFLISFY